MTADSEIVTICIRRGQPVRIHRHLGGEVEAIVPETQSATGEIIRLAGKFPEAYIAWFDERIEPFLSDIREWPGLVRHPLEILHLSCFQRCDLMVESLGLVDFDSPFLLPGPTDRRYPTWLISPIGGVGLASALWAVGLDARFKDFAAALFDLGYRGMQQGLCPYSEPGLLRREVPADILSGLREPLSDTGLALLIRRCFGRKWVLFWTVGRGLFRQSWPWKEALRASLMGDAHYGVSRLFETLRPPLPRDTTPGNSVDVVVPTLGRPEHVKNLLEDLSKQTVLPDKVILIEQAPGPPATSSIAESFKKTLPFEVDHQVVGWMGACRARNLGFERSGSDWVLLLDDDVRLTPGLLAYLLNVAAAYQVDAVNAATYCPGQEPDEVMAHGPARPWPMCGTAAILLHRSLVSAAVFFDERLEGGYGEDYEFGVRLRLNGGNILYAPGEPILHLKAPSGGFRQPFRHPWANESPQPRPSPILLYSRAKHSPEMMQKGYRLYYWLKRLGSAPVYRWAWELPAIARQWRSAVRWAGRLASQNQT